MTENSGKIKRILIIYWILVIYIIAALVWWFIALSNQNNIMARQRKEMLLHEKKVDRAALEKINEEQNRKHAQYIGEGAIFLLLIIAGAVFLFRAVKTQLRNSRQQQNFMMAITHELKTPIAVTRLNLETIQKRQLDEGQKQKIINNTLQEANRMNDLCNNLLLSSQMEGNAYRISMEHTDITGLLEKTVKDYRQRFPERTLRLEAKNHLNINCDVFLMQMAINNLIDNAVKYSKKDTEILLATRSDHNYHYISVADEGIGIKESEKEKVFEKFYRSGSEATKKSKGTGLGLHLVKRIVDLHKGIVYVETKQEPGTCISIRLNKT